MAPVTAAHADCHDAPTPVVLSSQSDWLSLAGRAAIYEDQSGTATIEVIERDATFVPHCQTQLTSPRAGAALWLRFVLQRAADAPARWVLTFDTPTIDHISAFASDGQGRHHLQQAGRSIEAERRPVNAIRPAIVLDVPTERARRFYVRLSGATSPTMTGQIAPLQAFQASSNASLVVSALFHGLLLALIGFTLVACYSAGLKHTKYYVLYLSFLLINSLLWDGLPTFLFGIAWSGAVTDRLIELAGALASICMLMFVRQVLRLREAAPRADRLVMAVAAAVLVCGFIALIDPARLAWPLHVMYVVLVLVLFALSAQFTAKGYRPAGPLTLAFLSLIAGLSFAVWFHYLPTDVSVGTTTSPAFLLSSWDWAFYFGFGWEALFMCIALSSMLKQSQRDLVEAHAATRSELDRTKRLAETADRRLEAATARVAALEQFADRAEPALSADARLIEAARLYVQAHIDDPELGVKQLADGIGVSEQTLRRRLRNVLGVTPAVFVRTQRLDRARQLLTNRTYDTVAQVTYAVGLSNPGHFARLYREAFGQSPVETLKGGDLSD